MNSDLRQRVPIGILYVIVIATSLLYKQWSAMILIGIFYLTSLFEFQKIESGNQNKLLILILFGNLIIGFLWTFINLKQELIMGISAALSILFLVNGLYLFVKNKSFLISLSSPVRALIYLSISFLFCFYYLMEFEKFRYVLIGSFIIIWLNDAGAYFVGKAIGKRKILPKVSPGKSWEGWIGGLVIGSIATLIIAQYYKVLSLESWLIVSVCLAVTGLIGDLTESSWKRYHKIKDSGTILKGHGGILDRLDSFIYSLPFLVLLFEILH